jgi:hypothetical protein
VLLSLDPHTAQLQFNALDSFCKFYGLEVNLSKSAAVVFRGKASPVQLQLTYRDQQWPQQDTYTYLGLDLSGIKGVLGGSSGLQRAGQRAAMATLARCRQLHITDADTALRLFNSQVLPCLLYGAEVWLPLVMQSKNSDLLTHPLKAIHHGFGGGAVAIHQALVAFAQGYHLLGVTG